MKVILFDADGVLTVPEELFTQFYARSRGLDPKPFEDFFRTSWKPIVTGKKDLKESIEENESLWQWNGTAEDLIQFWCETEDVRNNDLIDMITELRELGYKTYLATDQEVHRAKYMKEVMFSGLFDGHFVSSDLGFNKSDSEFFEIVKTRLSELHKDLKPEEVIFFDDSQSKVDSALQAGLDARLYKSSNQVRELLG